MSHPGFSVALNGSNIDADTLDGVTITYGRQRVTEQPNPSTCQVRVFTDMGDWTQVQLGDALEVLDGIYANPRFTGTVVSVSISRYVTTVTASSSALGGLARQRIRNYTANPGGTDPLVGDVLRSIIDKVSVPSYGAISNGYVTLLADIELGTTSALSAMQSIVASDVNGVLYETPAGVLAYEAGRTTPGSITRTIPAGCVADSWQAVTSMASMVNACTVNYAGNLSLTVRDYDSISTYGVFMAQRTMQVTGADDAIAGGMAWVNALREPHWVASPLTFELTMMTLAEQSQWLTARVGSPVNTASVAAELPGIPSSCWVEGWTETISRNRWLVQAYLSDLAASVRAQQWREVTPTLTWASVPPTLTWLQASSTTL